MFYKFHASRQCLFLQDVLKLHIVVTEELHIVVTTLQRLKWREGAPTINSYMAKKNKNRFKVQVYDRAQT